MQAWQPPCIYAYEDYKDHEWAKATVVAAERRNIETHSFSEAREVPNRWNTKVFLRMHLDPRFYERDRAVVAQLREMSRISLIPSARELDCYNDKIAMLRTFPRWMPPTWLLTDPQAALNRLDEISYPFISKSAEGAGSHNVRLVRTSTEALAEMDAAFGGPGIVMQYGQRQRDYLLWQEFCPNNTGDWRVILIGQRLAMLLRRHNRPDLPFASGSGSNEAINELSAESTQLLNFGRAFALQNDFVFTGIDIVLDGEGSMRVLESTTSWKVSAYHKCRLFEHRREGWRQTEMTGADFFDVVVDLLVSGRWRSD